MTLIIQKPTGAKLVMAKDFSFDPDAAAYIAAVEAADTQALETATRYAINNFIIGCKQDGIWNAIKASCILAGARTRLGALTPLVGSAPTSFGFVDGDYDRKTGLQGATNKYLDSNRANNADSNQNDKHIAFYATTALTAAAARRYMGSSSDTGGHSFISTAVTNTPITFRCNSSSGGAANNANTGSITGLVGASRVDSSTVAGRANRQNYSVSSSSVSPNSANITIFTYESSGAFAGFATNKIAFYSIGESLDLALLDARVTDLINAFAAAIP